MKQIVQGDGQKPWKDTKPKKGISCVPQLLDAK